jgi:hypothetical protein
MVGEYDVVIFTIASAERENFEHLPNLQIGGNDRFRAL